MFTQRIWTGASGRAFLAALVAGYEVAVRASAARVPWYKDKMYSTGIWGVFGATVAAGKLLGGLGISHGCLRMLGGQARTDLASAERKSLEGLPGSPRSRELRPLPAIAAA